ncbi:unnamed protein product [Caenorhabditis brenneri]
MFALTSTGNVSVGAELTTRNVSSTFDCNTDGKYYFVTEESAMATTEIPQETTADQDEIKTTEGGGGVASTTAAGSMCDSCDIDNIAPETVPDNSRFGIEIRDPVEGCLRTWAKCQRTDSMVCNEVFLYAVNPTGTHSITNETSPISAAALLSCDDDGTYSWGDTKMISKLSCVYVECF